jgi:hypothetical protein
MSIYSLINVNRVYTDSMDEITEDESGKRVKTCEIAWWLDDNWCKCLDAGYSVRIA